MKLSKSLTAAALMLASSLQVAYAVPIFEDLATKANDQGANITLDIWNTTPLENDELWTTLDGAAMKFKSELSGYNNAMGYADANGNNKQVLLLEGDAPGNWINFFDDAPSPFTFYLTTNRGHHWYSDESLNRDGQNHLLTFQRLNGDNRLLLFWDDQHGGGDRDYNDFVARVDFVTTVPEPGSLALLGLGLAGLGLSRRKKR